MSHPSLPAVPIFTEFNMAADLAVSNLLCKTT